MPKAESLRLESVIELFVQEARAELTARWSAWKVDLTQEEVHECVGALLARQVTLATGLALAPSIWTGHFAPLVLRSMADVFIGLAWIVCDPLERSRRFIHHGLGALKLSLEHRRAAIGEHGGDPEGDPLIQHEELWIDSQRFRFLTEVDVGSWSGLSTRAMAKEAGHEDFYNYVYAPFSACTHSMWHHIARYNLISCENPLHRYHREPMDPDLVSDPQYLLLASKYLRKSLSCFDQAFGIDVEGPSCHDRLVGRLKELEQSEEVERSTGSAPGDQ